MYTSQVTPFPVTAALNDRESERQRKMLFLDLMLTCAIFYCAGALTGVLLDRRFNGDEPCDKPPTNSTAIIDAPSDEDDAHQDVRTLLPAVLFLVVTAGAAVSLIQRSAPKVCSWVYNTPQVDVEKNAQPSKSAAASLPH